MSSLYLLLFFSNNFFFLPIQPWARDLRRGRDHIAFGKSIEKRGEHDYFVRLWRYNVLRRHLIDRPESIILYRASWLGS